MEDVRDPGPRGARRYCITHNNYRDEDYALMTQDALPERLPTCTYCVVGKEKGEQGTEHLQIYLEFKDAISIKALQKKLFPCWMKQSTGHPKDAAGYCKKGTEHTRPKEGWRAFFDKPNTKWNGLEWGTISHQGKRTDIDEVVEDIQNGATMREVARAHPAQVVKYHRGLQVLRSLLLEPRNLPAMPEVIVLWGVTGTGKTHRAFHHFWPDIPHHVWRASSGAWFDGYDGQDKLILEEFRGQMKYEDLLGLLDKREFNAPVKGGFIQMQASKFVITSPLHPRDWYTDLALGDHFDQLWRRITTCFELTEKYQEWPNAHV